MGARFDLGGRTLGMGVAAIVTAVCIGGAAMSTSGCSPPKSPPGESQVAQAGTVERAHEVSLAEAREEWRTIRASLAALTSRATPTATATAECAALVSRAEELAETIPRTSVAKGAFDPRPGLNRAVGALKSQAVAAVALVGADRRAHELAEELAEAEADLSTWTRQVEVNPGVQYLVDEAEARRVRASVALARARRECSRLEARYRALAARAAEGAAAWEAI